MHTKHTFEPREVMHSATNVLPVFTAREIRSNVTQLDAKDCVSFLVHTDCDYQINGLGPAAPLAAGTSVRGMPVTATHVLFNTPVIVEIM